MCRTVICACAACLLAAMSNACHHQAGTDLATTDSSGPALNISVVRIGGFPQFLAASDGFIWGIGGRPRFWKLDERTDEVTPVPIRWLERDEIVGFAVGEGSIWISTYPPLGVAQKTVRFDAHTGEQQTIIESGGAIAVGEGSLWTYDPRAGALARFDAQTNAPVRSVAVRPGLRRVIVVNGMVWLLGEIDGVLTRVDPQSNRAETEIIAGEPHKRGFLGALIGGDAGFYTGVCVSDDAAFVADHRANTGLFNVRQPEGTVARVNLPEEKAATPRPVGRWPMSPVEFAGWIWLTALNDRGRQGLVRVDPSTGHVAGEHQLPRHRLYSPPSSITLVAGETALWAGSDGAMQKIEIEAPVTRAE
jgi:hypothetical protein